MKAVVWQVQQALRIQFCALTPIVIRIHCIPEQKRGKCVFSNLHCERKSQNRPKPARIETVAILNDANRFIAYRRSITIVPVAALSVLRPCSKVTKVNLGIDYRPHVRWRFSKKHFPYFCSGIQCTVIAIEVRAQIRMRSACCVS